MSLRIAMTHHIFSMHKVGGISRYFAETARSLTEHGEQVRIFAPLYCNEYLAELPRSVVRGWHVRDYPRRHASKVIEANRRISSTAITRWRPDVVHTTYYGRPPAASAKFANVLTVYDLIHVLMPELFGNAPDAALQRKAVERADHIICISENTRQDLIEHLGVPADKATTIHLGVTPLAAPKQAEPSEDPYLLFVGQRYSYKNFLPFLDAYSSSAALKSDFRVVAVGGTPFTTAELEHMATLGLKPGSVAQRNVDDAELGTLYRNAAAFVYPSLYEGFGLPPLEAMANDCPVVSSDASSMPEVIGDAAEYFDPRDIDSMKAAIERVVYDDGRRRELIDLGRKRQQLFTWDQCARETQRVYRSLAGR